MENAFDLLGLPPRFDIDPQELHRRYVAACTAVHPDRFSDPLQQTQAAEQTAAINRAFHILSDPERRAWELLRILGQPGTAEEESPPTELLEEILNLREQLEQAREQSDLSTLSRLRDQALQQRQSLFQDIAQLFQQALEAATPDRPPILNTIRRRLHALRYFQKLLEEIQAAMEGT